MNFGITDKSYRLLIDAFLKHTEVEQVIIFGSRAKGNFKNGSDIDFAIKGKKVTPKLAMNISSFLNEELPIPYKIDLIDYASLNHEALKDNIDRVGIEFYNKEVQV